LCSKGSEVKTTLPTHPPVTICPHQQIKLVQQGKPYVMFGDGALAACKPISEADLARFMADCISGETWRWITCLLSLLVSPKRGL